MFVLASVKVSESPAAPAVLAVMRAEAPPELVAVTTPARSALTAVRMLLREVPVLVPMATSPVPARVAFHVKVCEPMTNVSFDHGDAGARHGDQSLRVDGARADGVDAGVEAVAAQAHLPLRQARSGCPRT